MTVGLFQVDRPIASNVRILTKGSLECQSWLPMAVKNPPFGI